MAGDSKYSRVSSLLGLCHWCHVELPWLKLIWEFSEVRIKQNYLNKNVSCLRPFIKLLTNACSLSPSGWLWSVTQVCYSYFNINFSSCDRQDDMNNNMYFYILEFFSNIFTRDSSAWWPRVKRTNSWATDFHQRDWKWCFLFKGPQRRITGGKGFHNGKSI